MDHDKHGDGHNSTEQPTQTSDPPVSRGTAPTSKPMARLRFGSFGAASAPSRLLGDRAETTDPAEQELPPLSPLRSPVPATTEVLAPAVPSMMVLGGSLRQVASTPPPTSPLLLLVTSSPVVLGGSPRQVASTRSPTTTPAVWSLVRTMLSGHGGLPTGRGSPVGPVRIPAGGRSMTGHSVEEWWRLEGYQTRCMATGG